MYDIDTPRLSEKDMARLADMVADRVAAKMANLVNPANAERDVMNSNQAADYLCLSVQRVRALVASGSMPHYKGTNGRNYYRRAELDKWRLGRKVLTNAEAAEEAARINAKKKYNL